MRIDHVRSSATVTLLPVLRETPAVPVPAVPAGVPGTYATGQHPGNTLAVTGLAR